MASPSPIARRRESKDAFRSLSHFSLISDEPTAQLARHVVSSPQATGNMAPSVRGLNPGGSASATPRTDDWNRALEKLRGAYADKTIAGYRSDFRLFADWCIAEGLVVLPATPSTLARYLDEMIETVTAATLTRRVAAIVRVHRLLELPNPGDSEPVRLAMRRIKRRRPCRPKQALGIDRDLRERLISACGSDPAGKRDKALIAIGFEALCRRSELAAIQVDDLVETRNASLGILIRRGKTDQSGEGRIVTLSAETARIVLDWIDAAGLVSGPLICPVYKGHPVRRHLAGFSISRLLKRIARQAGLDEDVTSRISGHSLRVGAAQTLLRDGHDVLKLMKVGGWKSATTVYRYIEKAEIDVWS